PGEWMIEFEFHGYDSSGLKSNLKDYLNDVARSRGSNGLTENESKKIMSQLLLACNHLENYGIYHRNLKLDSIVIGTDNSIKLIDFGLAIKMKEMNNILRRLDQLFHLKCMATLLIGHRLRKYG
ncbi:1675_t:CDS:2, partial [Paraglomus brasilianum]